MTKYRAEDYIGKTFNRLTILEAAGVRRYHPIVLAQCSCGTVKHIELCAILTEHTKSCGCYNQELRRERGKVSNLKHGYFGKPEYKSWSHMLGRCYCETNLKYPQYGGRGIKVCDRWRTSFENFLEDMGSKPERQSIDRGLYTIGRIDNDGDYTPDNCRWESPKQQSNNRSSCKAITINGETLNRTQWIEKLGLNYASVISRLRMGWTEIDALTTPFQKKKPKAHTNNEDEQLPPQCNCRELDYEKLE